MPLDAQPQRSIDESEKETFWRDGVVCLRGMYAADWEQHLGELLDDVFAQSDRRGEQRSTILTGDSDVGDSSDITGLVNVVREANPDADFALEGGATAQPEGRYLLETDASSWHTGMRHHNLNGPLPQIIHELTGSERVVFYSDQLFSKQPGSRVKTPFHQDKPYFLVDGGEVAVAWVSPDQVDAQNGAMGYVKGSHLWNKTFIPSDFQTETGTMPELAGMSYEGLVRLDHSRLRDEDMLWFDTEPGDVIVHHWATLHGSRGNVDSSRGRRAASVRYALDGCHFYKRPSSPEPFRNTVGLADGDPLERSDRFPVAWP